MSKNYKSYASSIPYFLTFTVIEWLNVFTKQEYMQILWDSLQYCRKNKGMKLYGFVFMTNHMHLIVSAEQENIKLWEIIRDYKKYTAQKIIQSLQLNDNRKWILKIMKENGIRSTANIQYQFWIHDDGAIEINSLHFFQQKLNYIHYNPVRTGIVDSPEKYFWSSARIYDEDSFEYIDQLEI